MFKLPHFFAIACLVISVTVTTTQALSGQFPQGRSLRGTSNETAVTTALDHMLPLIPDIV